MLTHWHGLLGHLKELNQCQHYWSNLCLSCTDKSNVSCEMGLFSPPKNSEWCLVQSPLPSLWSCLLKHLIFSFGSWLFVTKPSFMLPYIRGNRKAGTMDWSFFEFHRSQMLKLHIWFFDFMNPMKAHPRKLSSDQVHVYISQNMSGVLLVWAHYSSLLLISVRRKIKTHFQMGLFIIFACSKE